MARPAARMLGIVTLLTAFGCRSMDGANVASSELPPVQSERATPDPAAKAFSDRLEQAKFLFWGELSHSDASPILLFAGKLPKLHDLGYRVLYLEVSDRHQAAVDATLANAAATEDAVLWDTGPRRTAWLDLFRALRALGGWRVEAIDFKERDGHHDRMRTIFKDQLDELTWCQSPLGTLEPDVLDLVLDDFNATVIARALGDTLSFSTFRDTWQPAEKVVIYYGAAHGQRRALPGVTYETKTVGFMGHHLAVAYDRQYVAVLGLASSAHDQPFRQELTTLALGASELLAASDVAAPLTDIWVNTLYGAAHFLSPPCRQDVLEGERAFGAYFDFIVQSQ